MKNHNANKIIEKDWYTYIYLKSGLVKVSFRNKEDAIFYSNAIENKEDTVNLYLSFNDNTRIIYSYRQGKLFSITSFLSNDDSYTIFF